MCDDIAMVDQNATQQVAVPDNGVPVLVGKTKDSLEVDPVGVGLSERA